MNGKRIDEFLREILPPDEYIFGYADLTGLLAEKYGKFSRAVSIGRKLDDAVIDELPEKGPTRAYLNHYHGVNRELERMLETLSAGLRADGAGTLAVRPTFRDDELDETHRSTLITDFSHKMAATRAGLGWIGKTDLFVSKRFGPRLRLATLLTDAPLPAAPETCDESLCGGCTVCVEGCPARAANGKAWNIHRQRDYFFDAFRCRNSCRELSRRNLSEDISLCGICVALCPVGRGRTVS